MKLSEKIRSGAKLAPQFFGGLGDGSNGTCAIGAALHAVGELLACQGPMRQKSCYDVFPVLWVRAGCPCDCENPKRIHSGREVNTMGEAIAHLNDNHRWSREAIAEWVETIENKLDAEAASKLASERKTESTTRATSDEVSTRQIELVLLSSRLD